MPRTRPSTRRCDQRSPPSWPATAWPQERISTWRMRPWSPRTIWRCWGRPCSAAAYPPRRGHVSASSQRRSRAMAGRTAASWRAREPPRIVLPPARERRRARWPSMARPIGPWSCLPRPRPNGDGSGWRGTSTPLLRGSRRAGGWRTRTRMSGTRMPRWRLRGSVPVRPPDHDVVVRVAERPQDGRGRPRQPTPRAVKPLRSGLKGTRQERAATMVRKRAEAGCCGWRTKVPTAGARGHRAGEVLRG
jgi:hypothetical protein